MYIKTIESNRKIVLQSELQMWEGKREGEGEEDEEQRRLVTIEAHVRNLDLRSRSLTVFAV